MKSGTRVAPLATLAISTAVVVCGCNLDRDDKAKPQNGTPDPWGSRGKRLSPPPEERPPPKPAPPPLAASTARPTPSAGAKLIETDPLLLVPLKLDPFKLVYATRLPTAVAVGFASSYISPTNQHLVAHVNINKSDAKPYPPDKNSKAVKVGDHDAVLDVAAGGDNTASIEWTTGGWHALVSVDYEHASEQGEARTSVERIAPQASAVLDLYLTGTPPDEADREKQLAAVAQDAVVEFVHRLEHDRITVIADARLSENSAQTLIVTVLPRWATASDQERRQVVQRLQERWADVTSPGDPKRASVQFIDGAGLTVGFAKGSLVTVNQ